MIKLTTPQIKVSPIKCQGIKTKLVRFIIESIDWSNEGRWIEPFVGSGVVVLNVNPKRALLTDINVHVIKYFHDIQNGVLTPKIVKEYLWDHGVKLLQEGEPYYYEVRKRFNSNPNSLDFLFLNRSCFNGVMRFNTKGIFNVPFGKKPERFRQAYITKIVNQFTYLTSQINSHDWIFKVADWRDTLEMTEKTDFVYADPPYIGRHTDYFNKWTESDALDLFEKLKRLSCGFALSTWSKNKYRQNPYLPVGDPDVTIKTIDHYYHVGSTESLRNPMIEALVIKHGYAVNCNNNMEYQLPLIA